MTGSRGAATDRKVDIFVSGFQKCGTSALCDLLDRHPEIGVCRPKEPAWFSGESSWNSNGYLERFPAKSILLISMKKLIASEERQFWISSGWSKTVRLYAL